jgi:hypothetical protein
VSCPWLRLDLPTSGFPQWPLPSRHSAKFSRIVIQVVLVVLIAVMEGSWITVEELCLLGSNVLQSIEGQPTFHRNISPPSSGRKNNVFFRRPTRCWLRHYAKSLKAEDSIPDEVIGFFNRPNPSSSTIALWPTQSVIDMSTRNLLGTKG